MSVILTQVICLISHLSPALYIGVTLAIFISSRNMPLVKEELHICTNNGDFSVARSLINFMGIHHFLLKNLLN